MASRFREGPCLQAHSFNGFQQLHCFQVEAVWYDEFLRALFAVPATFPLPSTTLPPPYGAHRWLVCTARSPFKTT